MSLLYKPKKDQTITCEIAQSKSEINFDFSSDCGKFGTEEMLASFTITPEELLQLLSNRVRPRTTVNKKK